MIKFKRLIIFACVLALAFATMCFVTGCGGDPEVKKVEVVTKPSKIDYTVGEEFSVAGGVVKVTYDDDTSKEFEMSAEEVTVSSVNTEAGEEEEKNEDGKWVRVVTVKVGKKSARFDIFVSYKKVAVTFDFGYAGSESHVVNVDEGFTVPELTASEMPVRDGYVFKTWYVDEALTTQYNFAQPVKNAITIYGQWFGKDDVVREFTFDNNYEGNQTPNITQYRKSGMTATVLPENPVRTGYEFNGWFADAEGGAKYDFNSAVNADTTVYAQWKRVATGVNTYTFEAENTDLDMLQGPGFSGKASAGGMIVNKADVGASGGRFLSFLYENLITLTFTIISDIEVDDVKLEVSLSAEIRDIVLTPDNYAINLNGAVNYDDIAFTNVPEPSADDVNCLPFKTFVIGEGLHLRKGRNDIMLMTNNSEPFDGTTLAAIAPLVDCIKLTTSAVVIWSSEAGLPKTYG